MRAHVVQGLLGCTALWLLAAFLFASGEFRAAGFAVLLAVAPWAWGLRAWIQLSQASKPSGWIVSSNDRAAGLWLAAFAIPAAGPATLTTLTYAVHFASSLPEAIPDRAHGRAELARSMSGFAIEPLTLVYHTQRIPDSLPYDLFQFSMSSPDAGRQFLYAHGFAPSDGVLQPWEIDLHPRTFPAAWLPFSVSSNLEVLRAHRGIAWIDPENATVYLVLLAGWR